MSAKRRARTKEQKQARRQMLLDAAWELFQEKEYEEIKIAEVAKAADLVKGTIYLYFASKQELFLAVQEQQLQVWFDAVDARLDRLSESGDIPQVARLICNSLTERPAMVRLLAILHVVLERNISYESAVQFKQMLLERIVSTGTLLEAALPFLLPGQGVQLCMWYYTFVLGLQQLVNPAPVIRQVIEDGPGLEVFALDFSSECYSALTVLLYGLKSASQEEKDWRMCSE